MTKLSASIMAASAALTAVLMSTAPALAGIQDKDTETRGGMLAGAQTPSISQNGSFVHRGKAIVWVPNETLEAAAPNTVVVRETGSASPRIRATTARGAFIQNGKVTTWVSSEELAERLRSASPSGRAFGLNSRVALLGGAEVNRDLLANLSGDYSDAINTSAQPPAVTKEGAFVHTGKTLRWVPNNNPGAMLGQ
ncbi:MAG: hypothetical protein V4671_30445 [Armatimonadota bacterium]